MVSAVHAQGHGLFFPGPQGEQLCTGQCSQKACQFTDRKWQCGLRKAGASAALFGHLGWQQQVENTLLLLPGGQQAFHMDFFFFRIFIGV